MSFGWYHLFRYHSKTLASARHRSVASHAASSTPTAPANTSLAMHSRWNCVQWSYLGSALQNISPTVSFLPPELQSFVALSREASTSIQKLSLPEFLTHISREPTEIKRTKETHCGASATSKRNSARAWPSRHVRNATASARFACSMVWLAGSHSPPAELAQPQCRTATASSANSIEASTKTVTCSAVRTTAQVRLPNSPSMPELPSLTGETFSCTTATTFRRRRGFGLSAEAAPFPAAAEAAAFAFSSAGHSVGRGATRPADAPSTATPASLASPATSTTKS